MVRYHLPCAERHRTDMQMLCPPSSWTRDALVATRLRMLERSSKEWFWAGGGGKHSSEHFSGPPSSSKWPAGSPSEASHLVSVARTAVRIALRIKVFYHMICADLGKSQWFFLAAEDGLACGAASWDLSCFCKSTNVGSVSFCRGAILTRVSGGLYAHNLIRRRGSPLGNQPSPTQEGTSRCCTFISRSVPIYII